MKLPDFTFEDLIHPMIDRVFEETVLGKKPMVFRGTSLKKNLFGNIITWEKFSDYINNERAVAGLQVITPERNKLCMEKENLFRNNRTAWSRKDFYEKKYVHELWNTGSSIILTKASLLSPEISAVANCIEKKFKDRTAADAHFYCSPNSTAKSFECHADMDDNYLVHAIGSVHWKVYNKRVPYTLDDKGRKVFRGHALTMTEEEEAKLTPIIDVTLTVGDLLYIPAGFFHKAVPCGPRISISVPVAESRREYPLDREYYDFTKNIS